MRSRCIIISLFLTALLLSVSSYAQNKYYISKENADCDNAIVLTDTIWGPTNAPDGYGNKPEISGDKKSLFAFEKEHNTVWYKFNVPYNSILSVDIIPEDIKDDYDFLLYKYTGENFCDLIRTGQLKPVRTCISRNDKTIGSKTGLSTVADKDFIHSGPGPSYSKSIEVKKDDVYYLILDNVYENGKGHTVILHYRKLKLPEPVENKDNKQTVSKPEASLNINVTDKETGGLVNASIKIYLNKDTNNVIYNFTDKSSCFVPLKSDKTYNIWISKKGYLSYTEEFKTGKIPENKSIKAELEKIQAGKNIVLENILFYGDQAIFLPESYTDLENLKKFLKENEGVKIEIQGHVNWPTYMSKTKSQEDWNNQLSVDRAKAVYDYLVKSGINQGRLIYKGYGSEKMIYPDARSEEQMKVNRRVEIKIISN